MADGMSRERTRTVLIVEDDAIVALDLEQALAGLGYRICGPMTTGEEAVAIAVQEPPDLLLMDVDLPGPVDGIEAARQIRGRLDVPVIFLTGHSDAGTLARAMAAEPFGYLLKPFQAKDLKCAIEVAVHKHRRERALRRRSDHLARLSLEDELTRLANRRGFFAQADQVARTARRNGNRLGLFFGDLDGLKTINDAHGHQAGDDALRAAAQVLRTTFRDADLLARVGGDEFLILALLAAEEDTAVLLERVSHAFCEFNRQSGLPFAVTLSVGAVTADSREDSAIERLVQEADRAMYISRSGTRKSVADSRLERTKSKRRMQ
jgi:diguanylate cyclase (GGDEF)-like protein